MKTLITIILLSISGLSLAGGYIGYAQGMHLNGEEINDSHPYIGYQHKNVGIIAYKNSFDALGVAPYYEFKSGKILRYSFKLGVTTGYNPKMRYGDHTYSLDRRFFINDKLMLFAVPGVSAVYRGFSIDLTLLGDSVNMGVTIRF